nr:immunoglobulin light chain junction region [Macaca mulatta]MOX49793.1 immunoglobulin light chain junction region [Macaca mulatta]
CQQETDWWTF